jgi:hypothetical protein
MKEAANSSGLSFDNERDSCSQNDQRIYASDHDAEINVGHNALRMEPDLVVGHRTSTRGVFPPKTSRANRDSVPAKKYKSAFRVRAAYLGGCSSIQRKRPSGGNAEAVRGCMPGAGPASLGNSRRNQMFPKMVSGLAGDKRTVQPRRTF